MGPQTKLAIIPNPEFAVGAINDWKRVSDEGKRIIFQSNRGGRFEIWSINADGGGLQQLTQAAGVICPVPSPNGARKDRLQGSSPTRFT